MQNRCLPCNTPFSPWGKGYPANSFLVETKQELKSRPGLNIWDILHILATCASGSIKMRPWHICPFFSLFLHPVKVGLPWYDLSILLLEQTVEVMRLWGHQQTDIRKAERDQKKEVQTSAEDYSGPIIICENTVALKLQAMFSSSATWHNSAWLYFSHHIAHQADQSEG